MDPKQVNMRFSISPQVMAGLAIDDDGEDITAAVLVKLDENDEQWTVVEPSVLERFAVSVIQALGESEMVDKANKVLKANGMENKQRRAMLQMFGNISPGEEI